FARPNPDDARRPRAPRSEAPGSAPREMDRTGLRSADCDIVGWGAKIVCYAFPTRDLIKLNPFGLVSKRASIHPFFMHYPDNLPKIPGKIRAAVELVANHQLRSLIAAVYPVRRFPEALRHALGGGGKVLLDFADEG